MYILRIIKWWLATGLKHENIRHIWNETGRESSKKNADDFFSPLMCCANFVI